MSEPYFLDAFKGENSRIPVWFMRQAGRYLPEYQAIKRKYSLEEMFETPELAADITCMPIDILGVDAAILFADILTLPKAMGFDIHFDSKKGPIVAPEQLSSMNEFYELPYLRETIQLINQKLPEHIPLIGFAGSPFTVATYLIEGGSSVNFRKTLRLLNENPEQFLALMEKLTVNTIAYLQYQAQSGIKVFQLFDTWAGLLRAQDFDAFVLPYVQRIFQALDLPSIYYVRNCQHLVASMDQCGSDFLSVCHTVTLGQNEVLNRTTKGIQGNLYNALLYASEDVLKREIDAVIAGARNHDKYIFNLSHGFMPDMDAQKAKFIVEYVHAQSWKPSLSLR